MTFEPESRARLFQGPSRDTAVRMWSPWVKLSALAHFQYQCRGRPGWNPQKGDYWCLARQGLQLMQVANEVTAFVAMDMIVSDQGQYLPPAEAQTKFDYKEFVEGGFAHARIPIPWRAWNAPEIPLPTIPPEKSTVYIPKGVDENRFIPEEVLKRAIFESPNNGLVCLDPGMETAAAANIEVHPFVYAYGIDGRVMELKLSKKPTARGEVRFATFVSPGQTVATAVLRDGRWIIMSIILP